MDGATLLEMLQVALVDKNAFNVVERSRIDQILKEQEFQASGMTEGQAAKIGALAGAQKVLLASISKISNKYVFIVKGIDTNSGVVDLTDQVMSYSIDGFIDLFPTLADRLVRKARGEQVAAFVLKDETKRTASPVTAPDFVFDGAWDISHSNGWKGIRTVRGDTVTDDPRHPWKCPWKREGNTITVSWPPTGWERLEISSPIRTF